jgi:multidrug efflux pump subunit AcrB
MTQLPQTGHSAGAQAAEAKGRSGGTLVHAAMRRPVTVIVLMAGLGLAAALALRNMRIDIFPDMGVPILYVAQPYGGMDPAQMEGFLTNYYEYHFLYITGIEHVESKSVQGLALMKLYFHPGTDMAQAMAETIGYVNRSRAFMPAGTVPPFVMRFDAGSVPVGFLVLSSKTRSIGEIQDEALFRVRPMFATLPGVSAPPPFGGNQRSIVVSLDPEKLLAYHMAPDEVIQALSAGNTISPSGNAYIADSMPLVQVNSIATDIRDLEKIAIRMGNPAVYVRDVGHVVDATDIPTGYGLVDGRRTVYIAVTKRADASTLSVVKEVRNALPAMRAVLPADVSVDFEFDQSGYVTRAMKGLAIEGALGACLTGLMVLLFLRDWRTALVVVLNIPLAVMAAVFALWLCGQTINIMTLGGLALAIGILVDEATVAIENIHTHLGRGQALPRAVLSGSVETMVPRLLAMLCILSVFIPSLFMVGVGRAMFVPLSLAVGFAMVASYLLSSTFVPVVAVWLLRSQAEHSRAPGSGLFDRFRDFYIGKLHRVMDRRRRVVPAYLGIATLLVLAMSMLLGMEIFPLVDTGQFQIRFRAPEGTSFHKTERIAGRVLDVIREQAGADNVARSLGYVGAIPPSYPVNTIFLFMSGPHEGVLRVALKRASGVHLDTLRDRLRTALATALPDVQFSFEAGDIVSEVMSFGSPTPIKVAVTGTNLDASRAFAAKLKDELGKIKTLRDLQYAQPLNYPTLKVNVDRELAGLSEVTATDVARSLVAATSSSRYVIPNFWADPKSGIGYQVQVEVPPMRVDSVQTVQNLPVKDTSTGPLLLRSVADVSAATVPGEYERYNMQRTVSMTANIEGQDLSHAAKQVDAAIRRAGEPPAGVTVKVRGQIPPMQQTLSGLLTGLGLTVVVILLLLGAYFQSIRLAIGVVSTVPAVLTGVVLALLVTRTTLNIQSFMGAIMAVGVAVANAILLTTFAERERMEGRSADAAAVEGARGRVRPILMTSFAMIAGMFPMALGLGESGEQVAPLGRAVIGGLMAATLATLLILPSVFAKLQRTRPARSASVDPDESPEHLPRGRAGGGLKP